MGKLIFRKPKEEDKYLMKELFEEVFEGKYPLKEFFNPNNLEKVIKDKNHVGYLAFDKQELVGCAIATLSYWNNSFEIGKTAVLKEYREEGIAKKLCFLATEECFKLGLDVGIGRIRNDSIYKISEELKMIVTGFLPALFKISEVETYLLSYRLCEKAKKKRVVNTNNPLYNAPVIKEITKQLNLEDQYGELPKEVIVGSLGQNIKIKMDVLISNHSVYIQNLDNLNFINKHYLQADLLIDKLAEMEILKRFGFEICAFLPAWFEKKNKRYDCVRMVNSKTKPKMEGEVSNRILEDLIKKLGYRSPR
ncbi:MAG: GNAT family N-acetyltransferase [Candidatus Woesearchaeota archaeon]